MSENFCEVQMMTGPGAYESAVRCPSTATGTFRRYWTCNEHAVDGWQLEEHQGRLYAWRRAKV
jgi:hypothetical protein